MMRKVDEFLWTERYRPRKVVDCILPNSIKTELQTFLDSNQIPHFLFSGSAGVGKTSASKAIADQLGADLLYINASNETGIDVIRNKVVQFASTASFEGNLKIVLLDEADRISANGQDALKATMEEFSKTTRFILTSNNKNRLIEPLHSRLTTFDFRIPEDEKKELLAQMMKRCAVILKQEDIEYDTKSLVSLVQKNFPDFRKTLNELQRYSTYGKIDAGVLIAEATSYEDLIGFMKEKKFKDVRSWIAKNSDLDPSAIFRYFYDNLGDLFEGKSQPNVVLLIAEAQKTAAIVVDQEINLCAFAIEVMGLAEWK